MACIEKFTFSRCFPPAAESIRRSDEPGPLTIMQNDDEAARVRAEAFAEGQAEGRAEGFALGRAEAEAEAAASAARHETEVLGRLCERLAEATGERAEISRAAERGALQLAASALRKALPGFHRRLGEAEVEALLADIAGRMAEPVTLTVAVHPDLAASLQVRLEAVAGKCRVAGRLAVAAEAGIPEGDCRITWSGGGAERQLAALLARIDDIVRTVAGDEPAPAETETSGSTEHHG